MNEITVAIPLYNAVRTLDYVVSRLKMQKIPNLKCLIMDFGSTDGARALVGSWQASGYLMQHSQEQNSVHLTYLLGTQDQTIHPWRRVYESRQDMAAVIKTDLIFFLDPDVLIRPLTLSRMLNELIENPEAAYVGLKYEDFTQDHEIYKDKRHIMAGATLWRKEIFQKLPKTMSQKELETFGCDCNFQRAEVEKLGFCGIHCKTMRSAEHLKGVFT